jgi:hypothetical protein
MPAHQAPLSAVRPAMAMDHQPAHRSDDTSIPDHYSLLAVDIVDAKALQSTGNSVGAVQARLDRKS